MFYYRYRTCSEVSLKELLYSEIYFSSPEECNDPFDSKTFYVFDADTEKWKNLLKLCTDQTNATIPNDLLASLAEHLVKKCPLTFEEATNQNLFDDYLITSSFDTKLITFIASRIQDILRLYNPPTRYFASFSKDNSEPLMWSHYADRHKGFCLVFRAVNGALSQSPTKKKTSINRATENGIAPSMTFGIPESFPFTEIAYEQEVKPFNAFFNLPVAVSGDPKDETIIKKLIEDRESHYTQKSKSWEYESEYRLMLRPPTPWLFGQHYELTKQERLFQYQPSQLVGIIYGARMEPTDKHRIKQILKERRAWQNDSLKDKTLVFSFIEYEASLSPYQRDVVITPTGLLSYDTMPASDPNFERLYKQLLDGWGWERTLTTTRSLKVD